MLVADAIGPGFRFHEVASTAAAAAAAAAVTVIAAATSTAATSTALPCPFQDLGPKAAALLRPDTNLLATPELAGQILDAEGQPTTFQVPLRPQRQTNATQLEAASWMGSESSGSWIDDVRACVCGQPPPVGDAASLCPERAAAYRRKGNSSAFHFDASKVKVTIVKIRYNPVAGRGVRRQTPNVRAHRSLRIHRSHVPATPRSMAVPNPRQIISTSEQATLAARRLVRAVPHVHTRTHFARRG